MRTKKLWVCFLLVIGTLVLIAFKTSRADDVYNFYFQKAPGPTTVIQGGPQSSKTAKKDDDTDSNGDGEDQAETVHQNNVKSSPASETNQNATKVEAVVKTEEKKSFSRWRFMLGKDSYGGGAVELSDGSYSSDSVYQSGDWTVGVQFNIWKSLGLDLRLLTPVGQAIKTGSFPESVGLSVGLDYSPFHIKIAGFEVLDLGFTGGYTAVSTQSNGVSSYDGTSVVGPTYYNGHQNSYYYGFKVAINIGDSFAVVGAAEEIPQVQNASRLTFGAVFKL